MDESKKKSSILSFIANHQQPPPNDLVVADDVDGAPRLVRVQLRHLHHLVHDALPGERGVAVDHDGHHLVPHRVAEQVHLERKRGKEKERKVGGRGVKKKNMTNMRKEGR